MKNRILVAIVAAFTLGMSVSAAEPIMKWLGKTHDFGAFSEEMGMVTCEFKVVNIGDEPLVIYSARANCGCTTPKYDTDPVQPGDTLVISVAYDAKGRPGKFNKNVYVTTNVGNVSLDIIGTVIGASNTLKSRYPVEAGDARIDNTVQPFGIVPKGKSAWAYVKGYNVTADSIRPAVVSKPEYVEVTFEPKSVGPGEQFVMTATAFSDLCDDWGIVTDSILLVANNVESARPVKLSTVMTVKEDFSNLTPGELANAPKAELDTELFSIEGLSRKSKPANYSLGISNKGNSPLIIRKVSSVDDAVAIDLKDTVIEKGKHTKLTIKVDPSKVGDDGLINARVVLITNDPSMPERIIRVAGEISD